MFKSIIQAIIAIFGFGTAVTKAAEKGMDSEKIQEGKFEIKKPTIELHERLRRQNKIFNKIKNVPDADVESFVQEFTDLNESDTKIMVRNVTDRIKDYRRDYPIISGWKRFNKRTDK